MTVTLTLILTLTLTLTRTLITTLTLTPSTLAPKGDTSAKSAREHLSVRPGTKVKAALSAENCLVEVRQLRRLKNFICPPPFLRPPAARAILTSSPRPQLIKGAPRGACAGSFRRSFLAPAGRARCAAQNSGGAP